MQPSVRRLPANVRECAGCCGGHGLLERLALCNLRRVPDFSRSGPESSSHPEHPGEHAPFLRTGTRSTRQQTGVAGAADDSSLAVIKAEATTDLSHPPRVPILCEAIVQPRKEGLLVAINERGTSRNLDFDSAPENLLQHHESCGELRRVCAIAAPPEVAEPTSVGELVVVDTYSAQIGPCAPTASAVNLSGLATIPAYDRLTVPIDDHVLSRHPRERTSASPVATKCTAPATSDLSVAALSSSRNIRFAGRSSLGKAVGPLDTRVAAVRLFSVVLHRCSPMMSSSERKVFVSDEKETVAGLSQEFWTAAYRPGIQEFAAARFAFYVDGAFVRIAFGNPGPPASEPSMRTPVFTHAVTMSAQDALELSKKLRDAIAAPAKVEGS